MAALAQAGGDGVGARSEILERFSVDLLHRPALGGQIVARLCAINDPSPKDEDLLDLLGAGLDAARIACENGKCRVALKLMRSKTPSLSRGVRAG